MQDAFTIDNLYDPDDLSQLGHDELMEASVADGVKSKLMRGEVLNFGDCHVGVGKHRTFTVCNHSTDHVVRFQWSDVANCKFVPAVGHIHPGK